MDSKKVNALRKKATSEPGKKDAHWLKYDEPSKAPQKDASGDQRAAAKAETPGPKAKKAKKPSIDTLALRKLLLSQAVPSKKGQGNKNLFSKPGPSLGNKGGGFGKGDAAQHGFFSPGSKVRGKGGTQDNNLCVYGNEPKAKGGSSNPGY
jgi:hypothetical protein